MAVREKLVQAAVIWMIHADGMRNTREICSAGRERCLQRRKNREKNEFKNSEVGSRTMRTGHRAMRFAIDALRGTPYSGYRVRLTRVPNHLLFSLRQFLMVRLERASSSARVRELL
jgi:hypothetical protein